MELPQGQGTEPTEAVISDSDDPSATLVIVSEFEKLEPMISFDGEMTSQVELDFSENTNPNDWFVMTVVFKTGEQGLYFVGMDDEFDDENINVSISSFTTRERPGSKVGIEYDLEAISTGTDLDSATVVLEREPDGMNEGEDNHDLSGTQDGVNNAKFEDLGSGQDYTLILTIYDTTGNEVSETRTQTAN